jgi:hypothetical protein
MTFTEILLAGQCLGQIVLLMVGAAIYSALEAKRKDGGNGRLKRQ